MKFDYLDALSGNPIFAEGIGHIKSPLLKDICSYNGIGHDTYNVFINFLTWNANDVQKFNALSKVRGAEKLNTITSLTAFDAATLLPDTRKLFNAILSFFIVERVIWKEEERKFVTVAVQDDEPQVVGEITKNNYDELRKLILQVNFIGIDKDDAPPVTHSSEHSKMLWEMAQDFLKKQAEKSNTEDKPEHHIGNIISKICAVHPSYNLFNIYDLTIFQLYDTFFQVGYLRSINLTEQVFSNHGGDDFEFENWLKPILNNV